MLLIRVLFGDHSPHLIQEWHPLKNGDYTPFNVTKGSVKRIWWICPKGHEYDMAPNHRSHGINCPYCGGKRISIENSLYVLFPDISKEFHPIKNKKTAKDYAGKSNKKVWWLGECGHEWEAPISNRTDKNHGCPFCSGVRICEDNSLGRKYPNISTEWYPLRNKDLSPLEVTAKSEKKVWWECSVCKNEWEAPISNRTQNGSGCPVCNESKGEKRIRKWLLEKGMSFESQKSFNKLKGINGGLLSFDFYLPVQNLLIEYQGQFHDGSGNNKYTKVNLKRQKEHDKRKKNFAESQGINLLEIWYWDFKNIEKILLNEINTSEEVGR